MKLEFVDSLILAHPFIKGFDQVSYCLSEEEVRAVAQGEISDAVASRKKEDIEGKEGAGPVYSTTFYIGLAIEPRTGQILPSPWVCYWLLNLIKFSWCYRTPQARYLLSNDRVYEASEDVGEV